MHNVINVSYFLYVFIEKAKRVEELAKYGRDQGKYTLVGIYIAEICNNYSCSLLYLNRNGEYSGNDSASTTTGR